jgi:hypothetical protein
VLQAIQYQACRDSTGQPTATKLTVGLNLDLAFPAANRCGGNARDKPALMQDAHADASAHELFVGAKVIDQGRIQICGEFCHVFQANLPQFKPAGQCLTEPSQPIDIELFRLKGFAMVHGQRTRIGCSYQVLPCRGGGNDHIPRLEQLEEQRSIRMEWVTRKETKIEDGERHTGLLLRIRKDLPHAAFDDRCDTTVQARVTIEQPP